ncbi:hypothetical protein VUR80DRAFT_6055 [Thermomyces stellatus]
MKIAVFAHALFAGLAAAQLRLPLVRKPLHGSTLSHREVNTNLTADLLRYSVNVTVGTPPQELSLYLSLDSPQSWVPDGEECSSSCAGGSYNFSDSSTYVDSDDDFFTLRYSDDSFVNGPEFKETVRVGDVEAEGLGMGLGRNGNADLTRGELSIGPTVAKEHSLVEKLIEGSVINSAAFSFRLDDVYGTSGNLLFGAVDTSAFDGPLQRISSRHEESAYVGFPVDFSILNYTSSSSGDPEVLAPQNDLPLILVRPTDMLTNLPSALARKIWHLAGATYDENSGYATIPCSGGTASSASELILGLGVYGNATARVPFEDLVIPYDIAPIGSGSDDDMCVFAIQSRSSTGELSDDEDGPWALGGVVLQNTYVVFDLVNDEVAFAPVRATDGGSPTETIVPFSSYGAEIPHSEDADGSPPDLDSPYPNRDSPLRGITAIILMILGVLLGVVGLVALLWFCWRRGYCCFRGRRKPKEPPTAPQHGPIADKIVYAGALPPALPPRPIQANVAQPPSGQLPLGCAWVIAPVPHAAPLASSAAADPRAVRSDAHPALSAAIPMEASHSGEPPTHASGRSRASTSTCSSTRPSSPTHVSSSVTGLARPGVMADRASRRPDSPEAT